MMRTLALLFALLVGGCATPVMMPRLEEPMREPPSWTIDVPAGWDQTRHEIRITDEPTTVYEARSTEPVGSMPILVTVSTFSFAVDDGTSEEFAAAAVAAANSLENVQVIAAELLETPMGPVGLTVLVTPSRALATQLAIVSDEVGYLITCIGDVNEREKVMKRCMSIVTSFTPM